MIYKSLNRYATDKGMRRETAKAKLLRGELVKVTYTLNKKDQTVYIERNTMLKFLVNKL